MKASQSTWDIATGWSTAQQVEAPQLVLLFGSRGILQQPEALAAARARWPQAVLFGCSTAGQIQQDEVDDHTLVATAVHFDHTCVAAYFVASDETMDSREAARRLAGQIHPNGLSHVMVLSDGLNVNGTELVKGLTEALPVNVFVTGGLAADGDRFEETVVVVNDRVGPRMVAALAFYGERLRVGCGSLGGWDRFGLQRQVTRSKGNILYELDGKSALALYKGYLGEHAKDLPSSGLLFPLAIRAQQDGRTLVRTILSVDEESQSLTFAGDIPEGWYGHLMRANFDRLVEGAHGAAEAALEGLGGTADLAVLISCVGRKLILKQRIEDEVQAVRDVAGPGACLAGFYSYGEIAPFSTDTPCELHNQTMTITTFREI